MHKPKGWRTLATAAIDWLPSPAATVLDRLKATAHVIWGLFLELGWELGRRSQTD